MSKIMIGSEFTYTTYAPEADMTFIMRDIYDGDKLRSTECIGWHYGRPEKEITTQYVGKLKAEYTDLEIE